MMDGANSSQKIENPKGRVALIDFSLNKYDVIRKWLDKQGMEVVVFSEPPKFLHSISNEMFDVCVVNLMVGGMSPYALISNVRSKSKNPDSKVIVISRQVQKASIQSSISAGANDFVAEPFENESLFHRILYHLTPKKVIDSEGYEGSNASEESWPFINLLLETIDLLSRTERGKEHESFVKILSNLASLLSSNRTSLMVVEQESNTAVVLATSDDPNFSDFPISLNKYPEIMHVIHTGNFVLIQDVSHNALTSRIGDQLKKLPIGSVMVLPVRFQAETIGVLTVKTPQVVEFPSMTIVRIVQAIANTLATNSNAKFLLRRIYRDFNNKAAG